MPLLKIEIPIPTLKDILSIKIEMGPQCCLVKISLMSTNDFKEP